MNRIQFISIAGGTMIVAMTTSYLLGDTSNLSRANIKQADHNSNFFKPLDLAKIFNLFCA